MNDWTCHCWQWTLWETVSRALFLTVGLLRSYASWDLTECYTIVHKLCFDTTVQTVGHVCSKSCDPEHTWFGGSQPCIGSCL